MSGPGMSGTGGWLLKALRLSALSEVGDVSVVPVQAGSQGVSVHLIRQDGGWGTAKQFENRDDRNRHLSQSGLLDIPVGSMDGHGSCEAADGYTAQGADEDELGGDVRLDWV